MHEVTHISYGNGRVDVVLDSSSQTSIAAPNFRFGDYTTLVSSCFTPKELDRMKVIRQRLPSILLSRMK